MKKQKGSALSYLLLSALGLSLLFTAAYGVLYWKFQFQPESIAVNYIPNELLKRDVYPSYKGEHPSFIKRPKDAFEYPIQVGEIGPVENTFAGPVQYPFSCMTEKSRLGQPEIDNNEGIGVAVHALDEEGVKGEVVGYSKDCLLKTKVTYYYKKNESEDFLLYEPENEGFKPEDVAKIQIGDSEVEYIVRVETGTINRFIYMIAMLRGEYDSPNRPDTHFWNKRLIYHFKGGVGIGKRQGKLKPSSFLEERDEQLRKGYAFVTSTGTQTSNHYNLWMSEEVAMKLKSQFVAMYGKPKYTVGIGGSGGAIQQYILAQNHPGLIDASISLYSYPDMITQANYAYDCELTEYYFDIQDKKNSRWLDWGQRQKIQGLNTNSSSTHRFDFLYKVANLFHGARSERVLKSGSSECIMGWRGLTPATLNPRFVHFAKYFGSDVLKGDHWTHWDDVKFLYGTDDQGYPLRAWDNVGVQYGLRALREGELTAEEFLDMNAKVGGWKKGRDMQPEKLWHVLGDHASSELWEISPWSHHNMTSFGDQYSIQNPAPRSKADKQAISAAYQSGMIFAGNIDIPVLDLRHYLEDQLDMHHLAASFATRLRMKEVKGEFDNHVVWVTRKPHAPLPEAFEIIDEWMINKLDKDLADAKPVEAIDRCYNSEGDLISEGQDVWDGDWNGKSKGDCTEAYPIYSTTRIQAGENYAGNILKCQLQPVDKAIKAGVYGSVDIQEHRSALRSVFPNGVCDYSKRGEGMEIIDKIAKRNQKSTNKMVRVKHTQPQKEPLVIQEVLLSSSKQELNLN